MRTTRAAPVVAAALALVLGSSVTAGTPADEVATILPINSVTGSLTLDPATSAGEFAVEDRVYHYREVPVAGSALLTDDPRLMGRLDSAWNWDIHASGSQPVPAWGTMQIDVPALSTVPETGPGTWSGTFTGIRRGDYEPFLVRAFLVGEGAYEGLCATLDIEAGRDAWTIDGVIHPDPMAG